MPPSRPTERGREGTRTQSPVQVLSSPPSIVVALHTTTLRDPENTMTEQERAREIVRSCEARMQWALASNQVDALVEGIAAALAQRPGVTREQVAKAIYDTMKWHTLEPGVYLDEWLRVADAILALFAPAPGGEASHPLTPGCVPPWRRGECTTPPHPDGA